MSRTSRNFEILVVEIGWWFSSGLEESFSVSRTKLFWKKRRNDRWNILTEKDGMDIKEILTQRRNIRLLGNNRMSNPRYTSVENEMHDGVHGRITGMLYTFRFVRLDSARGGFLIFIPLFADRLAGTTCTSARGQKWVGFAIIQFRPRITRARPTKEKARQMRMAKWKIPLRTVFRPYCFPFIAADVKKNHGNDTYIRHVAPAHVPPSSASGHFRDHRAARNE